jgi:hypothetical protein
MGTSDSWDVQPCKGIIAERGHGQNAKNHANRASRFPQECGWPRFVPEWLAGIGPKLPIAPRPAGA